MYIALFDGCLFYMYNCMFFVFAFIYIKIYTYFSFIY